MALFDLFEPRTANREGRHGSSHQIDNHLQRPDGTVPFGKDREKLFLCERHDWCSSMAKTPILPEIEQNA